MKKILSDLSKREIARNHPWLCDTGRNPNPNRIQNTVLPESASEGEIDIETRYRFGFG
jgi:hypothetical protein